MSNWDELEDIQKGEMIRSELLPKVMSNWDELEDIQKGEMI